MFFLEVNNKEQSCVLQIKNLSVNFDKNLSFPPRIKILIVQSQQATQINFSSPPSRRNPSFLHASPVLLIMTHTSPAWCTLFQTNYNIFNVPQNQTLRINNKYTSTNYTKSPTPSQFTNSSNSLTYPPTTKSKVIQLEIPT